MLDLLEYLPENRATRGAPTWQPKSTPPDPDWLYYSLTVD